MTDLPDPLVELEARYRQLLRATFEHLTLRGLSPTDAAVHLPLEQLYVDLRLKAEVPDSTDEARRCMAISRARSRGLVACCGMVGASLFTQALADAVAPKLASTSPGCSLGRFGIDGSGAGTGAQGLVRLSPPY